MLTKDQLHVLALIAAHGDSGRRRTAIGPRTLQVLLDAGVIQHAGRILLPLPEVDMFAITPAGTAYLASVEATS